MMAIVMIGGVYCPLSPRDPQHRLHTLVEQTESRLVLVHQPTKAKFRNDFRSFNIDLVSIDNDQSKNLDINSLSNVMVTSDNIAYVIFTSGSTGSPKGVSTIISHSDNRNT